MLVWLSLYQSGLSLCLFVLRHSASLWSAPKTEAGITKITAAWQRLLEKNGCLDLVRAGERRAWWRLDHVSRNQAVTTRQLANLGTKRNRVSFPPASHPWGLTRTFVPRRPRSDTSHDAELRWAPVLRGTLWIRREPCVAAHKSGVPPRPPVWRHPHLPLRPRQRRNRTRWQDGTVGAGSWEVGSVRVWGRLPVRPGGGWVRTKLSTARVVISQSEHGAHGKQPIRARRERWWANQSTARVVMSQSEHGARGDEPIRTGAKVEVLEENCSKLRHNGWTRSGACKLGHTFVVDQSSVPRNMLSFTVATNNIALECLAWSVLIDLASQHQSSNLRCNPVSERCVPSCWRNRR